MLQNKLLIGHQSIPHLLNYTLSERKNDPTDLISGIPLRIPHALEGQGILRGGFWDQVQKHSLLHLKRISVCRELPKEALDHC